VEAVKVDRILLTAFCDNHRLDTDNPLLAARVLKIWPELKP
jgi:hypothetical protein